MTAAAEHVLTHISVERLGSVDENAWNDRLIGVPDGFWRQSTFYGEYKRRFWFEEPLYLVAKNYEGEIVGQLLAFFTHPFGWGLHRRGLSCVAPIFNLISPTFYWSEGPVVHDSANYEVILDALVGWMVRAGEQRGCQAGRAIPSFYGADFAQRRVMVQRIFKKYGFIESPKATILIDLEQDLDTLFKNLKREARTKVRKAREQEVKICEVRNDDEGLGKLHRVMQETSRRNGVPPLSIEALRVSSWGYYYDRGLSRGFVSTHEGNLVSSQQVVVFNRIMCLGGVSHTDYSRENRIYGNDLMQWHMIEWGNTHGMRILDFAGIAPSSASPKMRAIYDFKSKWGGKEVEFGEFSIEYPSLRMQLHRLLSRSLGSKIKNWNRRLNQRPEDV